MNRYPLEPVILTLGVFTLSARQREDMWRHLGFIPNLDVLSGAQKANETGTRSREGTETVKQKRAGRSTRNYHKCLEYILSDLMEMWRRPVADRWYPMRVTINGTTHIVRAYMPIMYIVGDNKSQNTLCARVDGHSSSVPRITRLCDCSGENSNNFDTDYECKFIHWT